MKFRATRPTGGLALATRPQPAQHAAPEPLVTKRQIELVRATVAAVEPCAADLPRFFYTLLFERHPQVRELFPIRMEVQQDRLLRALLMIVDLVDDPDNLARFCSDLGRDHRKFGTVTAHYGAVGECLLATLAHFAGPAWTLETAEAWTTAYNVAAQAMDQAAIEDAKHRPAVWQAQITGHRRRAHNLAEITVQPDQAYPYRGGQFVSMTTPWWPRTWRYYSPAHAARRDNSITFLVRAVTGGRVSNALVRQAETGDVVTLGPPLGDLALDPHSPRPVVCVAGGTGLATARALIEQAVLDGTRRPIDLYVGARTLEELYSLDDLHQLARRHGWLAVRATVADELTTGSGAQLLNTMAQHGPWPEHDAYLAGPASLVVAAARVLQRGGIPLERLHHDPFVSLDQVDHS
ncbi:globin domain-containing protein [Kitasatospora viridis]|uniref:nitric oxide dioxygenase n=1 Tax=Kitasatospora viridis TaxID=281105 RepID=A0A561UQ52_9ACTN|nr:globin domain-containing protein [Kitasatospora viridis]TWG01480.1 NAD(P)H-flavin reductase [Kitasatospora viridis]